MTSLREGSVDQIGGVQGVVGTNDNAEMTDGEELGVVKTVNERHTGGICWIQKGVVLTTDNQIPPSGTSITVKRSHVGIREPEEGAP
ncbi:MAG: hypothetical protein WBJ06_06080 [Candidatus Methanoculleus thermohydrogenotrophicum]|jgi:hypothetical protein|nr:hypothetical protein [Candidatus Methanoculleus thermohydrogenotrophicum]HQE37468.1 hypothetical protein [Limnochordia bacterium]